MNDPNITWNIYDVYSENYIQENDYYLGSYTPKSIINIKLQVWNNKFGTEEVKSIDNANLIIYFENAEDNMLLNYCTVTVDNIEKELNLETTKGICSLGQLSGKVNNGLSDITNMDNYKEITITFSNLPDNLKNGLKNIFLDISIS